MRSQGPQPLIDPSKLATDADWIAAGRDVFDSMHLQEFRTADPRAFAWADDPDLAAHQRVTVAADGTIPGTRWLVDHDGRLKLTLAECSGVPQPPAARWHRRARRADESVLGFAAADLLRRGDGDQPARRSLRPPNEVAYESYGVPWLERRHQRQSEDDDGRRKSIALTASRFPGTFVRFNASPWFTTRIIGSDRRQGSALPRCDRHPSQPRARGHRTLRHPGHGRRRRRIGPHTFMPERIAASFAGGTATRRCSRSAGTSTRCSRLPNPNRPNELTRARRAGVRAVGLRDVSYAAAVHEQQARPGRRVHPFEHPSAPPRGGRDARCRSASIRGWRCGRAKAPGIYKVPSLKGVWYRGPLEHSGSIATLEDWFDPDAAAATTTFRRPGIRRT